MRGCLKHSSQPPSPPTPTSMATPPPTRGPTPPLLSPDVPSLAAKRRPPPSLTDACLARRCVHFCSEPVNKIFVADEWDRSPADVTPRLTYQEMLELKEIQRSLPHAAQPFDDPDLPELDARGIPRTHFLKNVPVALVPLIGPTTPPTSQAASPPSVVSSSKLQYSPCHSPPSRPPPSPPSTPPPRIVVTNPRQTSNPPTPRSPPTRTTEPWVPPPPPPRLPYNIPIQPRPLPRFNFLPLLETPAPPVSNPKSQPCQAPPLRASPPLPASQDLPKTPPDRTPSPRDEKIESPSIPRSCHSAHPAKPFSSSPSIVSTTAAPGLSLATTAPDRPLASQLLPRSSRSSSPNSHSNTKDAPPEDSTHLGAELARLWHGHSCSTDGETEAEESEAESSVVHTEADSDGEGAHARAVVASSGPTKVVRTPVAVATAADTGDDEEGEMSLVELENGVIAFVRTPRRR